MPLQHIYFPFLHLSFKVGDFFRFFLFGGVGVNIHGRLNVGVPHEALDDLRIAFDFYPRSGIKAILIYILHLFGYNFYNNA